MHRVVMLACFVALFVIAATATAEHPLLSDKRSIQLRT